MMVDTGQLIRSSTARSSKTRRNSEVQSAEIFKTTQQEINNYIQAISQKINKRIQQKQAYFVLAYQRHLKKVQRQLSVLQQKSDDQQKNLSADKIITHLTKQTALFRQQAMRLSNQLEDTLEDLQFYKRKVKQPQILLKKLQQRLKQMICDNKKLNVQLQNTKQQNKIQKEEIFKLKQQIKQQQNQQNIQKVDRVKETVMKRFDSPKYQCNLIVTETNPGNRTSKSSLSRKLFSNQKLRAYDSLEAESTARYSQNKKSMVNSNLGYHLKTQQSKNWPQRLSKNNTKNPSQNNFVINQPHQQDQFMSRLRRQLNAIQKKLHLKQNLVQGSKLHMIHQLLSDQASFEIFINLFNDKNEALCPIALVSSNLMSKMQHFLNFETLHKFGLKTNQKQMKRQKYFKNKKSRLLTGRPQYSAKNLQFI